MKFVGLKRKPHQAAGAMLMLLAGLAATSFAECTKEEMHSWIQGNAKSLRQQVKYPRLAQEQKLEGIAVMSLSIAEDGSVASSVLSKSSGHAVLDAAAYTVGKGKYSPPICDGKSSSMVIRLPIDFRLDD